MVIMLGDDMESWNLSLLVPCPQVGDRAGPGTCRVGIRTEGVGGVLAILFKVKTNWLENLQQR